MFIKIQMHVARIAKSDSNYMTKVIVGYLLVSMDIGKKGGFSKTSK